ncbi:MAG TPA: tyrosine--tRNA ligase [Candidatus Saccharimonadales bacterium]|nr:tyrosine--tRNA ligase [Candidatus Saccharimonadales bacterium]
MKLSQELAWRGFTNQTTLKDITVLDSEKITFYWGVDPSSNSMTVGNLAIAMMVLHFISHGHKAVLLVGGATGLIGDPDGKDEERDLKTVEEVAKNKAGIALQYQQIFAGQPFTIVDNYDWFKDFGYLQFLRDVGKHFSMTQLLQRDFIQSRIGQGGKGISYAEFSYSLIQGYDFLHLFRTKGVTLQVCGADQWGNSISGVDLIRKVEGGEAHIWSAPLVVNKATGKKFGKTENGAIWLDSSKTSVFDFYQFWLNADDQGVLDYLKIYTLLTKDQIDSLMGEFTQNPAGRAAQKALAYEVTKIVHGEAEAKKAKEATATLFSGEASDLTPIVQMPEGEHEVIEVLVKAGLATSNSEARRLFDQGGVKLNQQKVGSPRVTLKSGDLLQVGKRRFVKIS